MTPTIIYYRKRYNCNNEKVSIDALI